MQRLTKREWEAVNAALAFTLAGEAEDEDRDAMASAQQKVWQRLSPDR